MKKETDTPRDAYINLGRCITNEELHEIEDRAMVTIDNLDIDSPKLKKDLQ